MEGEKERQRTIKHRSGAYAATQNCLGGVQETARGWGLGKRHQVPTSHNQTLPFGMERVVRYSGVVHCSLFGWWVGYTVWSTGTYIKVRGTSGHRVCVCVQKLEVQNAPHCLTTPPKTSHAKNNVLPPPCPLSTACHSPTCEPMFMPMGVWEGTEKEEKFCLR